MGLEAADQDRYVEEDAAIGRLKVDELLLEFRMVCDDRHPVIILSEEYSVKRISTRWFSAPAPRFHRRTKRHTDPAELRICEDRALHRIELT